MIHGRVKVVEFQQNYNKDKHKYITWRTIRLTIPTLYFKALFVTVEKIITCALGQHNPWSAQKWRR